MPQTLAEWDRNTVPHLERITQCAEQIDYWCEQIRIAGECIKSMPAWETKAEAALNLSLRNIEEAKRILNNKPRGE